MQRVLVLGAGLVARPLVSYLLESEFAVTVATRTVSKAEALVAGHKNGTAIPLLMDDRDSVVALVRESDLVISLVPPPFHPAVARICLDEGKNLVTTSYIGEPMKSLDAEARDKGLLLLNEIGLDPGIDHMSAMRVIHHVEAEGGKVVNFFSACGALPAPEAADNPFSYKFAWSPIGVVRAVHNSGRFLRDGEAVDVPSENLFGYVQGKHIDGIGDMEIYTNRDCLGYVALYGVEGVTNMFRGTFRYPGHCAAWSKIVALGLTDEDRTLDLQGKTLREFTAMVAGLDTADGLEDALLARFGGALDDGFFERLRFIGLLSDEPSPLAEANPCQIFVHQMEKLMLFGEQERDMVVLCDEFDVEYPDGRVEHHRSLLVDYGIPGGDSATARTVSLPAAVATRMILEGKITDVGVHAPTIPSIYNPVLDGLAEMGIECVESVE